MKCSNCSNDYPVTSAYCTKCGENNPQYSFSQEKQAEEYSSQSHISSSQSNRSQSNTYQTTTPPQAQDETNYGLAVLSFFIPLVGFIIAASLWSSKPNTASACLQASFWSVGLIIFFNLVF